MGEPEVLFDRELEGPGLLYRERRTERVRGPAPLRALERRRAPRPELPLSYSHRWGATRVESE